MVREWAPATIAASLAALFVGCFLAACHSQTTAVVPDSGCPQTSEFGNTGCFEVRGQIIGAAGQALSGLAVNPRPLLPPRIRDSVLVVVTVALVWAVPKPVKVRIRLPVL